MIAPADEENPHAQDFRRLLRLGRKANRKEQSAQCKPKIFSTHEYFFCLADR
jgi:hypothetical protein